MIPSLWYFVSRTIPKTLLCCLFLVVVVRLTFILFFHITVTQPQLRHVSFCSNMGHFLQGAFFLLKKTTKPFVQILRFDEEQYFWNESKRAKERFPSISDTASVSLSLIIPAYNEQNRREFVCNVCFRISVQYRRYSVSICTILLNSSL